MLDEKTRITLKILNSLFNDAGTYTYSIVAPLEDNRHILQHLDDVSNIDRPALTYKMYVNGEFLSEGDVVVTNTVDEFEFYLKSGKSAIANILKSSYLDSDMNGLSWGDNPDGLQGINATAGKIYPEVNFTIFPIATPDEVFNKWDCALNELWGYASTGYVRPPRGTVSTPESKNFSPCVFVHYLMRRIVQGLGVPLLRNDADLIPDFNRVCIFAPRDIPYRTAIFGSRQTGWTYKYSGIDKEYKLWLPHIPASTFLRHLRDSFNLSFYFAPLRHELKIIHVDTIFSEPVVDLTHLYVADSEQPSLPKAGWAFQNSGEGSETMTDAEIEAAFEIHPANDTEDAKAQVDADTSDSKLYFKTADSGRYFSFETIDDNDSITDKLWATSPIEVKFGSITYDASFSTNNPTSFGDEGNGLKEYSVVGTTGNVIIEKFIFDEISGFINRNVVIEYITAKASAPVSMKIDVCTVNSFGVLTVIGSTSIQVSNTDYKEYVYAPDRRGDYVWQWRYIHQHVTISLSKTQVELNEHARLLIQFSVINAPGIAIGMIVDQRDWYEYTPMAAYIDAPENDFHEMNPLSNAYIGDQSSDSEIEERSHGAKMSFVVTRPMNNRFFQMPYADIGAEKEQKEYAMFAARGYINDERNEGVSAPFANPDVLDKYGKDYTSRLTPSVAPELSLRWVGEKGLVKQLFPKTVLWHLHTRRECVKMMKLSVADLVGLDLHNRIKIGNNLYFIDSIDVPIDAKNGLGLSTVTLYAL